MAAIGGGGAQLASFTDTESPPGSLAVGEGGVWVLGLEHSTLVAHRSEDENAGEAVQAAPRYRSLRAPAPSGSKGDGHPRANRPGYGEGHQDRQASRYGRERRPPIPELGLPSGRRRRGRRLGDQRRPDGLPDRPSQWQAGGEDLLSTPPRSRPGKEGVWFISADDTRAVTRIDPTNEPGGAEESRSEPRTSRASLSGPAMSGQPRRGTASFGGSNQDARRSSGRLRSASARGSSLSAPGRSGRRTTSTARCPTSTSRRATSSPAMLRAVQSLAAGEGSAWVSSAAATSADGLPQTCRRGAVRPRANRTC